MSKWTQRMLDNPEVAHENPEKWFYWQQCDKMGIENEEYPEDCVCPKCGAELIDCEGMVGEQAMYCANRCGYVWENAEQAIAMVI